MVFLMDTLGPLQADYLPKGLDSSPNSYWVDSWLQDISASLALHLSSLVVDQVLG